MNDTKKNIEEIRKAVEKLREKTSENHEEWVTSNSSFNAYDKGRYDALSNVLDLLKIYE